MRITTLVENTSASDGIGAEHGLSLYIESGRHKLLFDMGQTDLFSVNAEKLGINLSEVDIAVLSHGHYDHGGGLRRFFELSGTAPVYLSRYAFQPHYNGSSKYIGLDASMKDSSRFIFTGDYCGIAPGLTLYSCNDRPALFDKGSSGLNMLINGVLQPDDFKHEQYLLIEENGKRVLFSGCSHKGILNIAEWFKPDVLIGGFHFSKLPSDESLKSRAEYLNKFRTDYYTCHCTGVEQFEFMRSFMDRLFYLSAGQSITL